MAIEIVIFPIQNGGFFHSYCTLPGLPGGFPPGKPRDETSKAQCFLPPLVAHTVSFVVGIAHRLADEVVVRHGGPRRFKVSSATCGVDQDLSLW